LHIFHAPILYTQYLIAPCCAMGYGAESWPWTAAHQHVCHCIRAAERFIKTDKG